MKIYRIEIIAPTSVIFTIVTYNEEMAQKWLFETLRNMMKLYSKYGNSVTVNYYESDY
jgi:hypothetical protein